MPRYAPLDEPSPSLRDVDPKDVIPLNNQPEVVMSKAMSAVIQSTVLQEFPSIKPTKKRQFQEFREKFKKASHWERFKMLFRLCFSPTAIVIGLTSGLMYYAPAAAAGARMSADLSELSSFFSLFSLRIPVAVSTVAANSLLGAAVAKELGAMLAPSSPALRTLHQYHRGKTIGSMMFSFVATAAVLVSLGIIDMQNGANLVDTMLEAGANAGVYWLGVHSATSVLGRIKNEFKQCCGASQKNWRANMKWRAELTDRLTALFTHFITLNSEDKKLDLIAEVKRISLNDIESDQPTPKSVRGFMKNLLDKQAILCNEQRPYHDRRHRIRNYIFGGLSVVFGTTGLVGVFVNTFLKANNLIEGWPSYLFSVPVTVFSTLAFTGLVLNSSSGIFSEAKTGANLRGLALSHQQRHTRRFLKVMTYVAASLSGGMLFGVGRTLFADTLKTGWFGIFQPIVGMLASLFVNGTFAARFVEEMHEFLVNTRASTLPKVHILTFQKALSSFISTLAATNPDLIEKTFPQQGLSLRHRLVASVPPPAPADSPIDDEHTRLLDSVVSTNGYT